MFNTHWHLDHVGCNETLSKAGAKIIAHENVKKRLSTKIVMEALNRTVGKEKIEYMNVPPAHTDGDSFLFFPGPNVLHTGDLLFNGTYPFIDAQTRVIPGHGALGSKDDLKASRDMLATVHERLDKMAKDGKSVDDVVAAAPTKDFDAKWIRGTAKPDGFVRIAYAGLLRWSSFSL